MKKQLLLETESIEDEYRLSCAVAAEDLANALKDIFTQAKEQSAITYNSIREIVDKYCVGGFLY